MHGFGLGFSIMGIFSSLIFVLVFGMIIVTLVRGIGQWNRNNRSPRLTVPAVIAGRRTSVSRHRSGAGDHHHYHSSTHYYVTFQVESGDRMELSVSGAEYGMLIEGDSGLLTFQGTRYLGFERETGEN